MESNLEVVEFFAGKVAVQKLPVNQMKFSIINNNL
jgi:hypothetical protein